MMLGEMRRRWEARRIARIAEIDGHVFISNPPSSDTLARLIRRSRRSRGANPSRQRDRPLVGLKRFESGTRHAGKFFAGPTMPSDQTGDHLRRGLLGGETG
jgi:hypothetical protein